MKTLKIKEQVIFFSYLKKNMGWLCLDWPGKCLQKKCSIKTVGCTAFFFLTQMGHGKGLLSVLCGVPHDMWPNF